MSESFGSQEINTLKKGIISSLHCSLPWNVASFDDVCAIDCIECQHYYKIIKVKSKNWIINKTEACSNETVMPVYYCNCSDGYIGDSRCGRIV